MSLLLQGKGHNERLSKAGCVPSLEGIRKAVIPSQPLSFAREKIQRAREEIQHDTGFRSNVTLFLCKKKSFSLLVSLCFLFDLNLFFKAHFFCFKKKKRYTEGAFCKKMELKTRKGIKYRTFHSNLCAKES